jgi:hypothetical protein
MNDQTSATRSPCAPIDPARGLIRWLYCNNPFYVISAALVFLGLRASFDPNGKVFEVWVLLLGMAGYTLLLAGTACFLIRVGDAWDDVRTLMLLVVLMFLSISMIFDDTMTCRPALGKACYLGGLLFSVAVSEGMLRGVRLRLPALFRVPYYLFLSLFFLYPVALSPLLTSPSNPMAVSDPLLPWVLVGFPALAGVVALSLLPAARRGPAYLRGNGSPWRWPLYPWSLFVVLGVGICARSYYACISLHPVERSGTIFGLYFLVPFLFAVSLLLLEIGLSANRKGTIATALFAPALLVVLSGAGHTNEMVYRDFLDTLTRTLGGSPLYLTLIAAALFYGYARLRRVPAALNGLGFALAALAVVGPGTIDLGGLVAPRPWPMLALTILQLAMAVERRSSGNAILAMACFIATVLAGPAASLEVATKVSLALHLATLGALVIGALFDDDLGRGLCVLGALMLFFLGADASSGERRLLAVIPESMLGLYPILIAAIAGGYGHLLGYRLYLVNAAAIVTIWISLHGWRGYLTVRTLIAGLDQIALGLVSFLLAALISLGKTGALGRWIARRSKSYQTLE